MTSISNLGCFFCTVMIVDRGQVDLKGFLDIVHRVDEAAIALS